MNPVVFLDAGPLGLLSNPNRKGQTVACRKWLQALVAAHTPTGERTGSRGRATKAPLVASDAAR